MDTNVPLSTNGNQDKEVLEQGGEEGKNTNAHNCHCKEDKGDTELSTAWNATGVYYI